MVRQSATGVNRLQRLHSLAMLIGMFATAVFAVTAGVFPPVAAAVCADRLDS
jgi:hypothetical protein